MSNEKGISTPELNKLQNVDILVKSKKLQYLCNTMENMLVSLNEVINLVNKMKSSQSKYNINNKLLRNHLELIQRDEFFDKEQINKLIKEANLYTKRNLTQDYKQLETKYTKLSEYYKNMDRDYYRQTLEDINEDLF